jgi:hypothetical protein
MKTKHWFSSLALAVVGLSQVVAQNPPRIDDHFWRRKVVNRIDLEEKINRPLIKKESSYYRGEEGDRYTNKDGIVAALFDGLKENKYTAYDPDDLTQELVWEDVLVEMNQLSASATAESAFEEEAEADMGLGEEEPGFDSFPGDETEDAFFDPFAPPEEDGTLPPGGGEEEGATDDLGLGDEFAAEASNDMPSLVAYETVIHFVEDRIFDKNRSDMVYDIQYIEIIWVDPYGSLEDKVVCAFRYDQVLETLDQVQWKNRFNDAQYRSMREVFEMRMFHSYEIDISGEGVQSLAESEYRRQQLVEFEHHLWSY